MIIYIHRLSQHRQTVYQSIDELCIDVAINGEQLKNLLNVPDVEVMCIGMVIYFKYKHPKR